MLRDSLPRPCPTAEVIGAFLTEEGRPLRAPEEFARGFSLDQREVRAVRASSPR
jgi:hypothetical protein